MRTSRGLLVGTRKCALYADDLLLFITSPLTSTPTVYKILKEFSQVSGLQVNLSKSIALNVSVPPDLLTQLKHNFTFTWATDAIPYLGIRLTHDISKLFRANYPLWYISVGRTWRGGQSVVYPVWAELTW